MGQVARPKSHFRDRAAKRRGVCSGGFQKGLNKSFHVSSAPLFSATVLHLPSFRVPFSTKSSGPYLCVALMRFSPVSKYLEAPESKLCVRNTPPWWP